MSLPLVACGGPRTQLISRRPTCALPSTARWPAGNSGRWEQGGVGRVVHRARRASPLGEGIPEAEFRAGVTGRGGCGGGRWWVPWPKQHNHSIGGCVEPAGLCDLGQVPSLLWSGSLGGIGLPLLLTFQPRSWSSTFETKSFVSLWHHRRGWSSTMTHRGPLALCCRTEPDQGFWGHSAI